jgi:hypothetical protein
MATQTFLSNATVNITQGATTWDVSDQCSNVTLTVGNEPLESTAFTSSGSPAGRTYVAGLQTVEVSMTMYLAYGSTAAPDTETEAVLAACVGKSSTLVISPSGTTESAANPEYTITGAYLESFTPINSAIGELATVEVTFTGGTFARDNT